jgi:hypothetical protein
MLLSALLVLAGCDMLNGTEEKPPAPRVAEPALTAPDTEHPIAHVRKPRPRRVARPVAAPPNEENISRQLVGLTEPEMTLLLGVPSAKESSGPGRRWVYRNGSCVLTVAFYADVETRIFRSLSYEVRNDDNSDQGRRNCMAELERRIGTGRAEQAGTD